MRLTQIEKMLENHEKRIKELETQANDIPIKSQDKLKPELKPSPELKEKIAPIDTKKGQEQRENIRKEISEKAEKEKQK